ncbi:MAG: NADP-dependent oxidoreductase [Steroidobacteraceae bacterium]|jgi:NADPH-dependent curcumin reductase CurA
MAKTNRQIVLDHIPQGRLGPEHFRLTAAPVPRPGDGEIQLRTLYISLDAANRAWMSGTTYRSALSAGQLMAGGALAEVTESRAPGFARGDLVFGDLGWQELAVLPARHLTKLAPAEPITHLLSVYGVAGLTAHFGLLECGKPRRGDTVVVSAAAGSVGNIVGQIAKIKGCRTVGIAGGAAKCALLTQELGFDQAVDYRAGDCARAVRAACPDGVDGFEKLPVALIGLLAGDNIGKRMVKVA